MKRTPALLALILSLTACGGGGDGDDEAAGTIATTPRPTTLMMLVAGETAEPTSIDAGVYRIPRSGWSVADLTVTMPAGWFTRRRARVGDNPRLDVLRAVETPARRHLPGETPLRCPPALMANAPPQAERNSPSVTRGGDVR